jgi:hypothetical protein
VASCSALQATMQDGAGCCPPEFEEEVMALQSIYDSELQVERKLDGGLSLRLKIYPAPPAYIKASVTLHIPSAVSHPLLRNPVHA